MFSLSPFLPDYPFLRTYFSCMEHSLHLSAHHFIKALRKTGTGHVEYGDDDLALDFNHGEEGVEEEGDGEFTPGDQLGKILALVGLIRKSPQARAFWIQQCKRENLPLHALKGWVRTRWGSLYDVIQDLVDRRNVSLILHH